MKYFFHQSTFSVRSLIFKSYVQNIVQHQPSLRPLNYHIRWIKKKKKKPPLTEISFQQSTIGVIKIFHLHEICSKHCPPSTVTFASDFHLNFRHTISIHIAFHPSIHHLIMIFHLHELFSKHF